MEIIIGLVVAVLIVFVLYNLYAKIITRRNRALEALAGIDVQLTQRFELIPNILTMASKFMEHEKELFTSVTELRTQASENYHKADPAAIKDHLSASSRSLVNFCESSFIFSKISGTSPFSCVTRAFKI